MSKDLDASDLKMTAAAAQSAEQDGRIDEALQLWAQIRARHPSRTVGYLGAISTARRAGRAALANQLVVEGARLFPDKPALSSRAGKLVPGARATAERQVSAKLLKDLKETREKGDTLLDAALAPTRTRRPSQAALSAALARVEILESRSPGRADTRAAYLRLLQNLKRLPEARERGQAWLAEHPNDTTLVLLIAEMVDNSGELSAAWDIVNALRARVGSHPATDAALMSLTARLSGEGLEAICTRALNEHPRNPLILREWAVIAQRQGDWAEALKRWEAADRIVPKNPLIKKGMFACQLQLATDRAVDATDLAKFFGSFSSLGGTKGGCEFGMIQARYGSKALGLFRWSNIPAKDLIRGLHIDFEGLGTADNTELTTNRDPDGRDEYMVQDKAYNSSTHTLIYAKDAQFEKVRDQTMRRLAYLKDGLLDQLRKPSKIFVYKFLAALPQSERAIRDLWAAIRRHGPARLICVLLAEHEAERGTIQKLEDGLYVGFLSHMMGKNGVPAGGFDELGWKSVCSAALNEDLHLST